MTACCCRPNLLRFVLALALVGLALGVRLPGITSPAFDFAPARQTYDAMRARIIYLDGSTLPVWQEAVLRAAKPDVPQIEPPVMENLAAAAYTLTRGERLWIARLISIVFWLTGSVFVYRIARRLGQGAIAPLVSLATYLLLPFGIAASRSFQPDPLMIAATLGGVLAIVRFHERPTPQRLATASLASALAMLVKPAIPIFFLWGAFFSQAVARRGIKRGVLSWESGLFALASFAPAGMYYVWGTFIDGFLRGHTASIDPALWTSSSFWRGWRGMVANVVTYDNATVTSSNSRLLLAAVVALALTGAALAQTRQGVALLGGLWLGYVVFGLVFTAHVSTHLYYSLPLVPMIALSIAPLAGRMQSGLARGPTAIRAVAVVLSMLAFAVLVARTDRKSEADHLGRARMYAEIGAAVNHTTSAVHVDYLYTTPLLYYGWLHSTSLYDPYREEVLRPGELEGSLREIEGESGPSRYLIVTALDQLEEQPELRALTGRLTLIQRTPAYAIWAFPRHVDAGRVHSVAP